MKFLIKNRLIKYKNQEITITKIDKFNKILFVVYSRFGDGMMSFKIIKEFINKYPNKKYLLLTSPQLSPYAKEILNIPVIYANKRNPFQFFNAIYKIKQFNADLGLNPWSHGDDSEFFVTYAKKFSFFKTHEINLKTFNLYDRVRHYLCLNITKNKVLKNFELNNIKQIVITPLSTDITKNLSKENLDKIIKSLKSISTNIIIATPKNLGYHNQFIFKKSKKNSENFLKLLKESDLLVSVDSGPLHIGVALGIKTIAIFGPTAPETILDNNILVKPIRTNKLNEIFCFVKKCKNPICIDEISDNIFKHIVKLGNKINLKEDKCPL